MRNTLIALILGLLGTAASADTLRSARHLVKIETQSLSESSRQYNVHVFDAESRTPVARLQVVTTGDEPEETKASAGGTLYTVRIEPHGAAYLVHFTADGGEEGIDSLRGGFLPRTASVAPPARPLRAPREIREPKIVDRTEAVYTEEAKAAGAAGTVIVEALIDRSGFVREATAVKPMGYGLSESAVEAVKQWRFEASVHKVAPVEVVHEVTIEFKP
jgi:TonB family protein